MDRRRRRRRGPGGASRRRSARRRRVLITSASPTGDVSGDRSVTIQANVEDREGYLLSRHDIDVYLDGQEMRFDYRKSSGSLTCYAGRLSPGVHTVEIEAFLETDEGTRSGKKRWTFNVRK